MSLRPFLSHLEHDPDASRLADEGGPAFVSQSLRPYLIAALADRDVRRPTVVVAGDDRAARDLAADLRAWLRPRPVRFYPSRGVAYESHLAPPPHLVGLRVAALDALLDATAGAEAAGRRRHRRRAVARRSPTRRCARTASRCASASCSTSTRPPRDLVAAGYERVDQVEDRGQFAVRGGLLDVYPATEERAVRVDLFDDRDRVAALVLDVHPALAGRGRRRSRSRPPPSSRAEHRELAEIAALEDADERPDVAELLPVDRLPRAARPAARRRRASSIAAEEDVEPALRDHWQDVCAAFHDADAHHLYVKPGRRSAPRSTRARRVRLSSHLRRPAARVPRPGGRLRRPLAAARPSPSSRSSCAPATRRVVAWPQPRRGRARRLQPRRA